MNNSANKASAALSLEQFAERLVQLMPRLVRRLMVQERNYLARGLITLPQLWVLHLAAESQACTMCFLAKTLGLKASTLTGLVDRLVQLGLLKRFSSRTDRRVVLAALTPKGRKILKQLNAERRRSVRNVFRHVSQHERMVYLGIIEKILKALASAELQESGVARPQD
ncbi:MAG: MarR family transcriptional regulator [Lentisphaerae bacterium]|nr:MarR family transcriptional regulator [Lentisphaerota bacterium]